MVTEAIAAVKPKGRPPRVPGERTRYVRVYFVESELVRVRQAALANYQSMSEFGRLAMSDAAEESGAEPIITVNGRQGDRRRRPGDDQPVELERRKAARRRRTTAFQEPA